MKSYSITIQINSLEHCSIFSWYYLVLFLFLQNKSNKILQNFADFWKWEGQSFNFQLLKWSAPKIYSSFYLISL